MFIISNEGKKFVIVYQLMDLSKLSFKLDAKLLFFLIHRFIIMPEFQRKTYKIVQRQTYKNTMTTFFYPARLLFRYTCNV